MKNAIVCLVQVPHFSHLAEWSSKHNLKWSKPYWRRTDIFHICCIQYFSSAVKLMVYLFIYGLFTSSVSSSYYREMWYHSHTYVFVPVLPDRRTKLFILAVWGRVQIYSKRIWKKSSFTYIYVSKEVGKPLLLNHWCLRRNIWSYILVSDVWKE
jgi:hypothetical protein